MSDEIVKALENRLNNSAGIISTIVEHISDAPILWPKEFTDGDVENLEVYDLQITLRDNG